MVPLALLTIHLQIAHEPSCKRAMVWMCLRYVAVGNCEERKIPPILTVIVIFVDYTNIRINPSLDVLRWFFLPHHDTWLMGGRKKEAVTAIAPSTLVAASGLLWAVLGNCFIPF